MKVISTMQFQGFNRNSRLLLCFSLLFSLSACSMIPDVKIPGVDRVLGEDGMFRDRKEDYLSAETIPPTEIPPGLDSFVIDDLLVIPELPGNTATAFPDPPRPQPMAGKNDREVVIQRMQERSWIIADSSPSQVWPRIRDYWRQKNIPITLESPNQGVMETGWFVLEGNVLTRDRIRVMVETGFQNNSSEIRILQMSAPQALPIIENTPWPTVSTDSTLAYDMTLDLSQYLADVSNLTQASTVSLQASTLSSEGKAALTETTAGNPLLTLQADIDRSWAAVRRVITRNEIDILQEDPGLGIMDVQFDPAALTIDDEEDEGPGFFKRVITVNGLLSNEEDNRSFQIRLQLLPNGEKVEVLAVPYQESGTAESIDAINTLMQLLRRTIA